MGRVFGVSMVLVYTGVVCTVGMIDGNVAERDEKVNFG